MTVEKAYPYRFARLRKGQLHSAAWIPARYVEDGETPEGWSIERAYKRILVRTESGHYKTVGWA